MGSRWTVPRGPWTRIRLWSSQSAVCTSLRVAPDVRRATECSAEACICACAPAIPATAALGVAWAWSGASPWRSSRRRWADSHVTSGMLIVRP